MFNVERFFVAHSSSSDVEGILSALSNLDDTISDQTYLNPVRNSSEVFLFWILYNVLLSNFTVKSFSISWE